MKGLELLKEGSVYRLENEDTTYPRMRYVGSRNDNIHFNNLGNGDSVIFDTTHKSVQTYIISLTRE